MKLRLPKSLFTVGSIDDAMGEVKSIHDSIGRKHGGDCAAAFDTGIWIAIAPLSEPSVRLRALNNAGESSRSLAIAEVVRESTTRLRGVVDDTHAFAEGATNAITEILKSMKRSAHGRDNKPDSGDA